MKNRQFLYPLSFDFSMLRAGPAIRSPSRNFDTEPPINYIFSNLGATDPQGKLTKRAALF